MHHEGRASGRDVLLPITMEGGTPGQSEDLLPTYEIMFRIFRETLTPRVGNWDQVHGYLIDLLLQCHLRKGSGEKLDVMNVIFEELWLAIIDKRVPIYAPYIMKLIVGKWAYTPQS